MKLYHPQNFKIPGVFFAVILIFANLFFLDTTVYAEEFAADSDGDGLIDAQETNLYHTDPQKPDTDDDGYSDGDEIKNEYSPLVGNKKKLTEADTDTDGLNDFLEIAFTTDLTKKDTDGDAVSDYDEVMAGHNPLNADPKSLLEKRLEMDLTKQRLYYVVDNKLVLNLPASTGNPGTPTPPGTYSIFQKVANKRYVGRGYDLKNVHWNMQFKSGGYFIHAAYWHNDFGKRTHSHGCINLTEKDSALLYRYIDVGTPVVVTGVTPAHRKVVG
jgi:hypothetical protein